jgi:hypothetical protein
MRKREKYDRKKALEARGTEFKAKAEKLPAFQVPRQCPLVLLVNFMLERR